MELYRISFPGITDKAYIGISSKTAAQRFKEHAASRKKYPIVQALKKYGPENALLEVIERFDCFDALYAAEQAAILRYGTKSPDGYNLTDGGKGTFGLPASEARKLKISVANKGRKVSLETRRKIGKSNVGRDMSAQVAAMARANKGRKRSLETSEKLRDVWTGRKHTEAAKAKMSESAGKRRASEETRRKMSESIRAAMGGKTFTFLSPDGTRHTVERMKEFCLANDLTSTCMYRLAAGTLKGHKGWSRV